MRSCSHVEVLYSEHQSQDWDKVYIVFRLRFVYVELLRIPAQKASSASRTGSLGTHANVKSILLFIRAPYTEAGRLGLALIGSRNY